MVEFISANAVALVLSATAFLLASFIHLSKAIESVFSSRSNLEQQRAVETEIYLSMRTFLWTQQFCFSTFISISFGHFILGYSENIDLFLGFSASLVGFSIVLSFYDDDVQSLRDKKKKKKWLVVYILILAVQIVSVAADRESVIDLWLLVLAVVGVFFAFVEYFHVNQYKQCNQPTIEYTCGMIDFFSFSIVRPLMKEAMSKGTLCIDDIPQFTDIDSCSSVWSRFQAEASSHRKRDPKQQLSYKALVKSLFQVVYYEWYIQGFFSVCASFTGYLSPLALQRVLRHVSGSDIPADGNMLDTSTVDQTAGMGVERFLSLELALIFLVAGPVLKGVCDGQTYARGRHIGVQIKGALISAIFHKSTVTNLSATKDDVGSVMNLISVDVSEVQEFMCYSHLLWTSVLETVICIGFIVAILGSAGLAGVSVLLFISPLMYFAGSLLMEYQDEMLSHKDQRMAVVNEVLNGIRIIKMFAWEDQFLDKMFARRSQELNSLRKHAIVDALQSILWKIIPILIAVATFLFYTLVQHKTLTPAIGFTALTLFDRLKLPVNWIPEMMNQLISAHTSLKRIHSFLRAPEVLGIAGHATSQVLNSEISPPKYDGRKLSSHPGCVDIVDAVFSWPTVREKNGKSNNDRNGNKFQICDTFMAPRCGISCCIWTIFDFMGWCRLAYLRYSRNRLNRRRRIANESRRNTFSLFPVIQPYHKLDNSSHHGGGRIESSIHSETQNPVHENGENGEITISFNSYGDRDNVNCSRDDDDGDCVLIHEETKEGDISCQNQPTNVILKHINLKISKGELVVIVGMTGTGKSTLISGMLGESILHSGAVGLGLSGDNVCGQGFRGISYAAQSAWIQNATLRDNILFGLPFDRDRYQKVVFACALEADFELMPGGDLCEIGEKGINLSGGQQQRVNIARAAYAKSSIIILDDVLSAVDPHVADHIFTNLVLKFLADPIEKRTCILISNQLSLTIPAADRVVVLGWNGQQGCGVVANTNPANLASELESYINSIDFSSDPVNLETDQGTNNLNGADFFNLLIDISKSVSTSKFNRPLFKHFPDAAAVDIDEDQSFETITFTPTKSKDFYSKSTDYSTIHQNHSTNDFTTISSEASSGKDNQKKTPSKGNILVREEQMAKGAVKWEVMTFYLNACGGFYTGVLFVLLGIFLTIAQFMQNYYLASWMNDMVQSASWKSGGRLLIDYLIFCALFILLTFLNSACSAIFMLKGGKVLHKALAERVVQAKISWFDATPIGRIVNRFSQDIVVIDQKLFPTLLQLIFISLSIVQVFIVIVVSIPFLLPFLIPIIICTQWVTNLYVSASREIKRLESVSKSPVFVLLSETLQGLSIIRSFQAEPRFYQECFRRVDDMNRCHLYMWLCNRWLNFKMQVFGGVTAGVVGLAIVLLVRWQSSGDVIYISSTAAGLSLVYSLGFTDYFTWFARFYADNQLNMNAVERVLEFSSMSTENYSHKARDHLDHNFQPTTLISFMRDLMYIMNGNDDSLSICSDITTPASHEVPSNFPKKGSIEFKNISLIYKSTAETFDSMNTTRDILSAPTCVVTALASAHTFWSTYISKIFHSRGITREVNVSDTIVRDVPQSIPVKVLSSVSFSIPAGHKVGIIGRTGAGKSSLITALFRLTEPELVENAAIYIDGVDVLKIPLQTLRSNVGIVPQDPLLFKGSIRFNLDPFNRESDEKLWAALRQVQMDQSVLALPNSVESSEVVETGSTDLNHKMVTEKGGNLSVGQRQLLCMARAIIRGTKILVMDEATASCDAHTDALIQETLMTVFQDCTVLIIAHRLHTVVGCDKIIVMDAGCVVENGAPAELLRIEGGRFRGMCEVSGDMARLTAMAANRQAI